MRNRGFEVCKGFEDKDIILPIRKTKNSVAYDLEAAEDTVIPSYPSAIQADFANELVKDLSSYYGSFEDFIKTTPYDLNTTATLIKKYGHKMTLVPTGVKCRMPDDYYLQLSVRSSLPLKHWIIMGNGVGIIDADYYNNPDNEGHIFFELINLLPFDVVIKKGDCIGQGILLPYGVTIDDEGTQVERTGGLGSTSA